MPPKRTPDEKGSVFIHSVIPAEEDSIVSGQSAESDHWKQKGTNSQLKGLSPRGEVRTKGGRQYFLLAQSAPTPCLHIADRYT